MKLKLAIGATTAIFAATATWATDFVWTGGAQYDQWRDSANWTVNGAATDSYPQTADDTATFNDAVTLDVGEENIVGKLILNAELTHNRDKWLTIGGVEGTGKLILKNRGRLRNINGTAVEFNNDIEIVSPDGTDWDHREAMPWIQANGANFDVKGRLFGNGHVFFTMAGYFGVRLYGDNSGFSGTIHVDSNSSNRMKFGEAQSGFANGKLMLYGSVNDNGTMLFSNGIIHFGSIYTKDYAEGAKFRSIDKDNTLIVGDLNSPDDRITLGMGDAANAKAKIIKVGTGTLELGPTRHLNGTIISNGVVKVTHPDGICYSNSSLAFDGGTLQYGVNPLDGNNPVTKDVSSYIKDSTEYIKVDTDNDMTWATGSIRSNNPNAKGIIKSGNGTLTFSSYQDNTLNMLKSSAVTNRIDGGTLAFKNSRRGVRSDLSSKILGTGTFRLDNFEDNGNFRLRPNGALEEFGGTFEWATTSTQKDGAVGFMLNTGNLNMPNVHFRVTGNPVEPTMIMKGETGTGKTVTVGAFDHLYPNAQLFMGGAWNLNINGTAGDSYLNGVFTNKSVTITKTGAGKLTIGRGFSAPEGSTINVNEGVFAMDAGMTVADLPSYLTIANGVKLSGEGVFGAVDLSVNDVVAPALTAETDKTTEFTLLTATSITGTSATMTALLETVNAGDTHGKWKLVKKANGDGTVALKCVYGKNAFVIILR